MLRQELLYERAVQVVHKRARESQRCRGRVESEDSEVHKAARSEKRESSRDASRADVLNVFLTSAASR